MRILSAIIFYGTIIAIGYAYGTILSVAILILIMLNNIEQDHNSDNKYKTKYPEVPE